MSDCVDRLPTSEEYHSFVVDDSHKCSINNTLLAETKPTADVYHQVISSSHFVVPIKCKTVNSEIGNECLVYDVYSARVNMARPVVMRTLPHMQSFSDKYSCIFSNPKLPDMQRMCTSDRSRAVELPHSLHKGQNVDALSSNPNSSSRSEMLESLVINSASDIAVMTEKTELSPSVNVKDVLSQQQAFTNVDFSSEVTVFSSTSDVVEHSSLRYLSEKVVDTPEKHNELLSAKDTARTQQRFCKDNQLKRIASKSKLKNVKASPGSLLALRSSDCYSRLSLKDAVGGNRPFSYSLMEVSFRNTNNIIQIMHCSEWTLKYDDPWLKMSHSGCTSCNIFNLGFIIFQCRMTNCASYYFYYYYAAFNVPCVGHKDDESQAYGQPLA